MAHEQKKMDFLHLRSIASLSCFYPQFQNGAVCDGMSTCKSLDLNVAFQPSNSSLD